ncbi:TniB family NTP-binding protein [Novosphingobium sp. JCM 18896]|uniref:TniB family NTP-binding protein n=1 Tax=Novosphingobium sp. JCM 18896 TaxID=2989731 RepID=UPI002221DA9B|nr:TniB family NTP-binding protein [Novosphingobium sp. JCM 18896]MCW1432409.1 TniB family NTP-binding protein [Novosphingobium sp. JCM 18896]
MESSVVESKVAQFELLHVPNPREAAIHGVLDNMRNIGRLTAGQPQRGLQLLAPSYSGKSTVLKMYADKANAAVGAGKVPVFYMELATATTPNQMYDQMRFELGDPLARVKDEGQRFRRMCGILQERGVELIIIDETAHILKYNTQNVAWRVSEAFKRMLNEGVAPIVFAGDESAAALFSNAQLRNRMLCPATLPKLDPANPIDLGYAAVFFGQLDKIMVANGVVEKKANLDKGVLPAALCAASGGVLGTACNIIREALRIALSQSAAKIGAEHISEAIARWAIPMGFVKTNPLAP